VKPQGSLEARAEACRERIVSIIRETKLPTKLSEVGVKPEQIEVMVPQAMADGCHASNPKPFTAEAARRLYEAAM